MSINLNLKIMKTKNGIKDERLKTLKGNYLKPEISILDFEKEILDGDYPKIACSCSVCGDSGTADW